MASTVSKEILIGFIEEAKSYIPSVLQGVKDLFDDPSRTQTREETFRLMHTIKGASAMVGLGALSTISYYIEEALEDIGNKSLPFTNDLLDLMVTTLEFIDGYLDVALADEFNEPDIIREIVIGFRRARNLPPGEDEQALAEVLGQFGIQTQDDGKGSTWSLGPDDIGGEESSSEMAPLAVDPEMMEAFWVEALDYIQEVNLLLADFQKTGFDKERVMEIRRKIHTLKGGAGAVGIESVARITHRMEDLLDQLYGETLEFSNDILDLLCTTGDMLEDIATDTSEQPDYSDLIALYDYVTGSAEARAGAEEEFDTGGVDEVGQFTEDLTALDEDFGDEDIMPELLEIFLLEAEDHLRTVNLRLTELAREGFDKNLVQDVRRSVHTLKGSAGSVGLKMVTALSHRMEDLLDLLYEEEVKWNNDISDLLSSSGDVLEDLVAGEVPPETLSTLQLRYNGLLGKTTAADLVSKSVAALGEEKVIDLTDPLYAPQKGDLASEDTVKEPAIQRQPGEFVRVPLERLDELVRLVSELVITRTTFEQRLGNLTGEVQELQVAIDRLRRISVNLETQYEVTTLGGTKLTVSGQDSESKREFDDLEMDRYTEFHLLTRELSETSGDIKTVGNDLGTLIGDFDSTLTRQSRISSELQEKLMRVRMVPLSTLATRLHRIVRVVARKQNKLATLDIYGEGVELDKMVMEEIADPLMHIIRNGVDHGIEPPELRRVIGKPETGTITLRGYNEGNQVVISIKDDGGGLDPQALRTKAISGGYLTEADAAKLSPEELQSLIFLPGFSTAGEVSEISGRGVGMDIVKENVHKLKGTISIDSIPGEGTTFTIRLPLTLAITKGLIVRANYEIFAVPLGSVTQIVRVEEDDIDYLGQAPVIRVGGSTYPVVRLGDVLNLPQGADTSVTRLPVLILQAGSQQVGLIVDQIIQGREVVIKPLGNHLRYVHGVTGATIMGDGSVVLILNPAELLAEPDDVAVKGVDVSAIQLVAQRKMVNVLIVDDSVSVRRVLTNLIRNSGWNPITAKDGLDALTQIQEMAQPPDIMLVDIEMPRMDGYELTATLRGLEEYKDLPIVMLTSRGGAKHRQKGFDVGATEYITKPYQDEMLTGLVSDLIAKKRAMV